MSNNPLNILHGRFSIYYNGELVIRHAIMRSIEVQHSHDYCSYSYQFSAIVDDSSFIYANDCRNLADSLQPCKISNGVEECDAYIDSYEVTDEHVDITTMGGNNSVMPLQNREIIIQGHIDGGTIDAYHRSCRSIEKKEFEPKPIESRFDIMDL